MTLHHDDTIRSCHELAPGDGIKAFFEGTLAHRGTVTELAPDHGLFWIMDNLTGSRRLLDMTDFQIVREDLPASGPRSTAA